jgi:hypothetical protein
MVVDHLDQPIYRRYGLWMSFFATTTSLEYVCNKVCELDSGARI